MKRPKDERILQILLHTRHARDRAIWDFWIGLAHSTRREMLLDLLDFARLVPMARWKSIIANAITSALTETSPAVSSADDKYTV